MAKPDLYEYQIEAIIEYIFKNNGAFSPGFPSIVGSGLDYVNAILFGIPNRNIQRLQRAQNALSSIVTADRSTSALNRLSSLHWLPIQKRITYKLATVVYKLHLSRLIN